MMSARKIGGPCPKTKRPDPSLAKRFRHVLGLGHAHGPSDFGENQRHIGLILFGAPLRCPTAWQRMPETGSTFALLAVHTPLVDNQVTRPLGASAFPVSDFVPAKYPQSAQA